MMATCYVYNKYYYTDDNNNNNNNFATNMYGTKMREDLMEGHVFMYVYV